jgi:ABC-type spermidine/putrescine transport system permease subunit I
MTRAKERLLRAGIVVGALMVVVPFVTAIVGIGKVSGGPEGLRGATHREDMKEQVGFALGSASFVAILVPPGVLLGVLCGLSLASGRRREARGGNASSSDS